MRVKSLVNVRIFEDSTEEDVLFGPSNDTQEFLADNFTEEHSDRFTVAPSGTFNLGLGSIAAVRGIMIRALGDFDLTLNGGPVIQVRRWPNADATIPAKFYFDGVVSSVSITNASAAAILGGYFAMWGDAA